MAFDDYRPYDDVPTAEETQVIRSPAGISIWKGDRNGWGRRS